MGRIYDAMTEWFRNEDWKFQESDTQTVLMLGFEGQHATWSCYAQAREEEQQFIFYVVAPFKVPEAQRMEIAEYLTRANYGLVLGRRVDHDRRPRVEVGRRDSCYERGKAGRESAGDPGAAVPGGRRRRADCARRQGPIVGPIPLPWPSGKHLRIEPLDVQTGLSHSSGREEPGHIGQRPAFRCTS